MILILIYYDEVNKYFVFNKENCLLAFNIYNKIFNYAVSDFIRSWNTENHKHIII
jgi:hypothetical protein